VSSILAIARRPARGDERIEWRSRDITRDELDADLAGADAVICLAWAIQPSRDGALLRATNVDGSAGVFEAAARAGVGTVLYASSVGAYAPGPKDRAVDETWSASGIRTSFYSRHKAEVETALDAFEDRHPDIRVVRMRPGLVFKRAAASEIRRLFAGPLLPTLLLRRGLIPFVPRLPRLRFQAVHSYDVGEAFRLALHADVRGAFNLAAEPVLDGEVLAGLLNARPVRVPAGLLRGAADVTWRLRLQPSPSGWVDLALGVPLMDSGRARAELGWVPRTGAGDALLELLAGMREGAGAETPTLAPDAGGPARTGELRTGVGGRT
jgi:nucleoside-diphosphate-sugar epimerase